MEVPYGYCHCGCGQKTRLAPRTSGDKGWKKGEPQRYCRGHMLAEAQLKVPHERDTTPERFWSRVDKSAGPDACWPWRGARAGTGYGHLWWDGNLRGAHRVAWELANGQKSPDGRSGPGRMVVMHTCDTPPCCNPAHLRLATQADNMRDMAAKRRSAHGERSGNAKLTNQAVREIRALRGVVAQRDLAKKWGVSQRAISRVMSREGWAWAENV